MATQMSAVTICCTTGQGYASGLRFVQMYFGLPLAMVILSLTVVPFFTRARVYTAYEYLEQRFDVRVRSLASFLFLSGRALALGVTLSAPSVVMSAVLGWTLPVTVLAICVPMILYTTIGGVQAVAWTDVKQMFIVVGGMSLAVAVLLYGILQHVSFGQALRAGRRDRPSAVDRFQLQSQREVHVLVGHDRRPVSDAVVLRLRSEPGAALSHGEIDRRGAPVADDERVREDPAAAADSGERRARLRVLRLRDAADALQSRLRRADRGEPAGSAVRGAAAGIRRGDRHPQERGRTRRPRGVSRQRRARQGDPRARQRRRQAGDRRSDATTTSTTCSRPSSPRGCRSGWSG